MPGIDLPAPEKGGVNSRKEATGKGVYFGLREVCNFAEDLKPLGLSPGLEGKSVVVLSKICTGRRFIAAVADRLRFRAHKNVVADTPSMQV